MNEDESKEQQHDLMVNGQSLPEMERIHHTLRVAPLNGAIRRRSAKSVQRGRNRGTGYRDDGADVQTVPGTTW